MADLGTIYYQVDAKADGLLTTSKQVDRQLSQTEKGLSEVERAAGKTNRGLGKLADAQSDLAKQTEAAAGPLDEIVQTLLEGVSSSSALNQQLSLLARAIQAVIAASALKEIAGLVQGYEEMADRVRLATSSNEEFEMVQRRLVDTANGTYRSLSEAQELYIRTADSLRAMGYSTSQAIDVTDSMAYAFVTNAASADKAAAATDALSKVLAKGKVEADAWETILAATPSVIDAVARASGKTAQEVRSLGASGKLSAADLTEGLRKALGDTAKAAAEMSNNLTDAGVRTQTALTAVFVAVEKQTGAWQKLTNGIIMAADWLLATAGDSEKLATLLNATTGAATALAAVVAGRVITAFVGFANAQIAALQAALASVSAAQAAAQANVNLAVSEYNAAQAAVAQQRALIAAGGSMLGVAADANNLAIAEGRAAVATQGLSAAQAALAGTATRASIAMGGLRTVMGFLGGPAGVVLLAAAALYTFTSNTKTAKTEVDALNGSLEKLTFNQMTRASNKIKDEVSEINKEYSALLNKFNTMAPRPWETKDSESFIARQAEVRAELDDVNQALATRNDRLKEIAEAQDRIKNPPAPPPTVAPVLADDPAAAERIQALKDEEALLKKVGVERAKLKALQQLGDGATPKQKAEAEELAASIYRLEEAEKAANAAKTKRESESSKASKKAANELLKGTEANQEAFAKLGAELGSVGKSARELAMDQAQLSLNEYATPEQIEAIRGIAAALYDAKNAKQLLAQVDPVAAAGINYTDQLKRLQEARALDLVNEQQHQELKNAAATQYEQQRLAAQEQIFAAQNRGNALLIDSLNALGQTSTQVLSGILSGTMSSEDAVRSLANTIFNQAVGAVVDWGIAQVKAIIMGETAQAAAAASGIATGTALASAYTPAAIAASIATFGGAATAGTAAMGTAVPAMTAMLHAARKNGGTVAAGGLYRVNEGGAPEIFTGGNGQQYLMPNKRGQVVSNADATGGGGGAVTVNVYNQAAKAQVRTETREDETGKFVSVFVEDMDSGGPMFQALQGVSNVTRVGQ